jgi:GNAT superfamily N-acetyltransferase
MTRAAPSDVLGLSRSVTIRNGSPADACALAKLGAQFFEQSQFADIMEYAADDVAASLNQFMSHAAFICFVAEADGVIVGAIAGVLAPVYYNRDHLSGEELFWWVDPAHAAQGVGLRLLSALEREAADRGAISLQMKSIDRLNGERMAKVYERRGYRPSEHSFIKRL